MSEIGNDLLWLIALWLVPIGVSLWARRRAPMRLWLLTGLAFGAVVAPASMGLYGLYFVGPIPALIGMLIGLPLTLLHSGPGYQLAMWCGLIPPREDPEGTPHKSRGTASPAHRGTSRGYPGIQPAPEGREGASRSRP